MGQLCTVTKPVCAGTGPLQHLCAEQARAGLQMMRRTASQLQRVLTHYRCVPKQPRAGTTGRCGIAQAMSPMGQLCTLTNPVCAGTGHLQHL
jgi:hypothetical protein